MNSDKPNMRKLLTIITEAALERTLLRDIEGLGAKGHTVTDARGRGSRGMRQANWEAASNIRIEVVCDEETADKITQHLQANYYDNYGMIMYTSEVEVLRPEKFN